MGLYDGIDQRLYPWAKSHGLHIFTQDRECEVRSTMIVDDAGNTYQLSLEPSTVNNKKVSIHFGFHAKRRVDRKAESCETSLENLTRDLNRVYAEIEKWIADSGNTRTPVL